MNNTGFASEKTNIHFEKANSSHLDIIFGWLSESFVQKFWDNTQGHKDDILNFVNGRKEPSNYCDGKYFYWIASCDGHPFAMLMTIQETTEDHIDDIKLNHLSKTGNTYGIDYMIGDKNYFGKGYGTKTLSEFIDFFRREFDVSADTFIIDPASDNPRAKHVYMKAGFEHIADFVMSGDVSGAGKPHHLLIKRFLSMNNSHIEKNITFKTINPKYPLLGSVISSSIGSPTTEKIAQVLQSYEQPNQFLTGAFSSNNLIAIIGFELKGTQATIKHISVVDEFRKQGIGNRLIRKIIKDHALSTVSLVTDDESVGFYKKLGFKCQSFDSKYGNKYRCHLDLLSLVPPEQN